MPGWSPTGGSRRFLIAKAGDRAGEAEFARDDLLGEIAGADEVGHDVDLAARVWRRPSRK